MRRTRIVESTRLLRMVVLAVATAVALWDMAAGAASPTCRDWQAEHRTWKARTVQLYLDGSPQRELDAALFELVQREAWLTACDLSIEGARAELVGWRLVDRAPDEYGAAVLESVLVRAGMDLALRSLFANGLANGPLRAAPQRASH